MNRNAALAHSNKKNELIKNNKPKNVALAHSFSQTN